MGRIDREKHDIDVVERVLAVTRDDGVGEDGRAEIISVDVRHGMVASTVSTSQMTIGALAPPERRRRSDD